MQLKEKPELNQINQESEVLAKTYQLYRPIKEPKSVARVDRTNLQPIKEPKSVATVDRANLQPIKEPKSVATVDRANLQPIKEPKSVAKVDRTNLQPIKERKSVPTVDRPNLQPIKEPKSVAKTDRQDLRPIKNRKSVAKTEWPDLPPLKERKSVTTVDIQPKEKLDLNQINQKLAVLVKTYRQDLQPIKERKSVATTDRQDLQPIKERESVATTYQPDWRPIKEHKSGGGTLRIIEFFVVVIIIGILSSIALPSFLHCGNKAMQSEAKQYLSSMNRAQQAYFADKGAFSNSITALGLGIKTETANYNYSISATKNAAFSYGVARRNNLRSYVGAVFLAPVSPAANNEKTTTAILCETNTFDRNIQPPNPILENNVPVCAAGSSKVSK